VTRLLLAVLGCLVLAGAVVGGILLARDEDPPTTYDAEIEENFISTCTADAEDLGFDQPDGFCDCVYSGIRQDVPFDRFLEIDEALRTDPGDVPPVIGRIRTRCFLEHEAGTP
jgi:hypothetical protein